MHWVSRSSGVGFGPTPVNAQWVEAESYNYEVWNDLNKTLALYYGAASSPSAFAPSRITVFWTRRERFFSNTIPSLSAHTQRRYWQTVNSSLVPIRRERGVEFRPAVLSSENATFILRNRKGWEVILDKFSQEPSERSGYRIGMARLPMSSLLFPGRIFHRIWSEFPRVRLWRPVSRESGLSSRWNGMESTGPSTTNGRTKGL